jgi:hypothetical protein
MLILCGGNVALDDLWHDEHLYRSSQSKDRCVFEVTSEQSSL